MLVFLEQKNNYSFHSPSCAFIEMLKRNGLSFLGIISYSVRLPVIVPALSAVLMIASRCAERVIEICSFLEARTEDEQGIRKGETAL